MLANFSNLITFSRGSNATVTDASGRLTYAPHNLVTNSQDFEAAAWVKLNGGTGSLPVVTANSAVAPDGSTTADTIVFTQGASQTVNDFSLIRQSGFSLSGIASVYLRANSPTTVKISADDVTYTVCNVTTQWQRFFVYAATATRLSFGLRDSGTGTSATVFAWGAQLEAVTYQTTPSPYVSTSVANLLGFSEDFTNAVWTKSNCSVVIGMDQNPINNLWNAQKLMVDTATAIHRVAGAATVNVIAGVRYTLSVYAKAAGTRYLYMNYAAQLNAASTFDLQTGTVSATASGTASITSVGNGWYRCSVTGTAPATAGSTFYLQLNDTGVASDRSYTGDGNSGIYMYGAQLSNSGSLDPYVPTPGAAPSSTAYYGPRFDYDPVTLAAKGILIEEQRTNLLTYSEQFDNAAWVKVAMLAFGSGSVVNATLAPDGTTTADLLVPTTANTSHYCASNSTTVVTATNYVASIYVKAAGYTKVAIRENEVTGAYAAFDLATGTVLNQGSGGTGSITPVGNGWYRISMLSASSGTVFIAGIFVLDAAYTTGNPFGYSYAGNGTSGMYFWGAQLEAGSFATSYIPTVASQVTRTADVASITGSLFSQWYRQDEGTLVVSGSTRANCYLLAGAGTAALALYQNPSASVVFEAYGSPLAQVSQAGNAIGSINKAAAAYAVNNFGLSVNGAAAVTDTSAASPAITDFRIGYGYGSFGWANGHIRNITYIPNRVSDTQLQSATT